MVRMWFLGGGFLGAENMPLLEKFLVDNSGISCFASKCVLSRTLRGPLLRPSAERLPLLRAGSLGAEPPR